jgi:hypothetical protein
MRTCNEWARYAGLTSVPRARLVHVQIFRNMSVKANLLRRSESSVQSVHELERSNPDSIQAAAQANHWPARARFKKMSSNIESLAKAYDQLQKGKSCLLFEASDCFECNI